MQNDGMVERPVGCMVGFVRAMGGGRSCMRLVEEAGEPATGATRHRKAIGETQTAERRDWRLRIEFRDA